MNMNIIKPLVEVIALCAGAAAGIFIMNIICDSKEKEEKHECKCHHDANGDCCGGG